MSMQAIINFLKRNSFHGCFENLTSVQYQEARYRVIDAFVARAIAFFRTGGLHNRTENLRTSLQPYLQ
jgi:hypothetical protein